MTGPAAPRVLKVLKFDGPFGPEGCGIDAMGVDEYIAAYGGCVTGLPAGHRHSDPGRRILVRDAYEAKDSKYRSAGELPALEAKAVSN